jgi:hypothetical protein
MTTLEELSAKLQELEVQLDQCLEELAGTPPTRSMQRSSHSFRGSKSTWSTAQNPTEGGLPASVLVSNSPRLTPVLLTAGLDCLLTCPDSNPMGSMIVPLPF